MQTGKVLRMCLTISVAYAMITPLMAQNDASRRWKNMFTIGAGAGIPSGDLKQFMSPSAAIRFIYGYRIARNIQADFGFDMVIKAARDYESSKGKSNIEFVFPLGGRAILPLSSDRLELFAGAGGAWLRYNEGRGNYCSDCVSRGGWGVYGTAGANVALEHKKHVWLGIEGRYTKGTTSGKMLGTGVAFESKDCWLITTLNLIFRF
jgi:hypothetical protein